MSLRQTTPVLPRPDDPSRPADRCSQRAMMRSSASSLDASMTAVIGPLSPETAANGPPRMVPTVSTTTSTSGATSRQIARLRDRLPHVLNPAESWSSRRVDATEFEDPSDAIRANAAEVHRDTRRHPGGFVDIGVSRFVEEYPRHVFQRAPIRHLPRRHRLHPALWPAVRSRDRCRIRRSDDPCSSLQQP